MRDGKKHPWSDGVEVDLGWCGVCGTEHGSRRRCPGDLPATGPENPGWKVNVETPRGIEAYGVLLAPCHRRWRARILTYPRVLWLVPGGDCSLKFIAKTADQAERKASRFIREHCLLRGYVMRDELALADEPAVPRPIVRRTDGPTQKWPRYLRRLPVRFGEALPSEVGLTRDLSEGGLFVITDSPASRERNVGLLIQLEHCTLPLRGLVMWTRYVPDSDRPVGMGVRLVSPPQTYVDYIRALQ